MGLCHFTIVTYKLGIVFAKSSRVEELEKPDKTP